MKLRYGVSTGEVVYIRMEASHAPLKPPSRTPRLDAEYHQKPKVCTKEKYYTLNYMDGHSHQSPPLN